MKKQIVLKSFSALSFDLIVRQTPVHRLALTQDGHRPDEARSPVDLAKATRTETTGPFPDRNHSLVNGRDRGAWLTATSSAR